MAYKIVPIQSGHIGQVVDVHILAFPDFFLTFLGPRFLAEFYKSFTYNPDGIGFVAEDTATGKVLGVVVGPLIPGGYFKKLLIRRWWAFCVASIFAVVKKPSVAGRLFRAMFYRGDAPAGPDRSLLSSIAVDPRIQKQGLGKALVQAWVDEVRRRGGTSCYLTTDAENNDAVNHFYQSLGWKLEASWSTPQGRPMNRYVLYFENR